MAKMTVQGNRVTGGNRVLSIKPHEEVTMEVNLKSVLPVATYYLKEVPKVSPHTLAQRIFRPVYLDGRPAWQKALFWAGPGH
jgi:hypothetical protein